MGKRSSTSASSTAAAPAAATVEKVVTSAAAEQPAIDQGAAAVDANDPSPALVPLAGTDTTDPVVIGTSETALSVLVAAVVAESGLTVFDWNETPVEERQRMLDEHFAVLRAQAADEQAQRAAAEQALASQAQAVDGEFPKTIRLFNNSSIALSEPFSGAHLGGGGSAEVVLHDAEHAQRVLDNFRDLLDRNFLDHSLLVVQGL